MVFTKFNYFYAQQILNVTTDVNLVNCDFFSEVHSCCYGQPLWL